MPTGSHNLSTRPPYKRLLFLAALLVQIIAHPGIAEPLPAICSEGTEDPPLELHWNDLPKEDSLTTLAGSAIPMTLHNKSGHTLFVDIAVVGALDAAREQVELGTVALAPFTKVNIAFDLSQFNYNVAYLDYAARLVARATARFTHSGAVEYMAYTPHAFVHPKKQRILAYRVKPMLEQFGSGDFAGHSLAARQWAAKRGIKLMGIGPAARGLKLTDDDGGPREGR